MSAKIVEKDLTHPNPLPGPNPHLFTVVRHGDESGVSGTGRVLDGVMWHNGKVSVCWRTDIAGTRHGFSSITIYDSFEAFKFIHIDSHPTNDTEIVWY